MAGGRQAKLSKPMLLESGIYCLEMKFDKTQ